MAAGIVTVTSEKAGLEGEQAECVAAVGCPVVWRGETGLPSAMVGIEAGGDVDSQGMCGAAIAVLQQLLQWGVCCAGLRVLTKSKQGINHHVIGAQCGVLVGVKPVNGGLACLLPRVQGVVAAALWVAQPMNPDSQSVLCQCVGGNQAVAAVVAGTAEYPGLLCVRSDGAGQLCH